MDNIRSKPRHEFIQLTTETFDSLQLFREIMNLEPVEPELQAPTHTQEQDLSEEMKRIIENIRKEGEDMDEDLLREILFGPVEGQADLEPVEPELQADTHTQEQDLSEELERIIENIRKEGKDMDDDLLREILFGPVEGQADLEPVEPELQADTHTQEQHNNVPAIVTLPEGHILHCIGILNGQPLYNIIIPPVSAPPVSAPPVSAPPQGTNSKKRKRESTQEDDDGGEYVKKPPNAFMLFMTEQRAIVEAELNTRGSAAVNTVLGQRWKSLTKEEQAKYYEQAQNLKELHVQQHPEWSNKNNYGKKKKRIKGNTNVPKAEESASRERQRDEDPSFSWMH